MDPIHEAQMNVTRRHFLGSAGRVGLGSAALASLMQPRLFAGGGDSLATHNGPGYGPGNNKPTPHAPPLLYNLDEDPSEQFDVAKKHPDVLKEIAAVAAEHKQGVHAVPSQLERSRASAQE